MRLSTNLKPFASTAPKRVHEMSRTRARQPGKTMNFQLICRCIQMEVTRIAKTLAPAHAGPGLCFS